MYISLPLPSCTHISYFKFEKREGSDLDDNFRNTSIKFSELGTLYVSSVKEQGLHVCAPFSIWGEVLSRIWILFLQKFPDPLKNACLAIRRDLKYNAAGNLYTQIKWALERNHIYFHRLMRPMTLSTYLMTNWSLWFNYC